MLSLKHDDNCVCQIFETQDRDSILSVCQTPNPSKTLRYCEKARFVLINWRAAVEKKKVCCCQRNKIVCQKKKKICLLFQINIDHLPCLCKVQKELFAILI